MKPVEYYRSIPPELIDFSDPDVPESIKISARLELQNRQNAALAQAKERKKKQRQKWLIAIIPALLGLLAVALPYLISALSAK